MGSLYPSSPLRTRWLDNPLRQDLNSVHEDEILTNPITSSLHIPNAFHVFHDSDVFHEKKAAMDGGAPTTSPSFHTLFCTREGADQTVPLRETKEISSCYRRGTLILLES
jgi:hypothetical protein